MAIAPGCEQTGLYPDRLVSPLLVRRPRSEGPVKPITTVRVGGLALVFGAIAFMAVSSFLAARFDYPAILDGPADAVLPRLLATGTAGRAAWALYAFLPLIWLPAGVGAYCALRRFHPRALILAKQWAPLAPPRIMPRLLRRPTVH